MTRRWRNILGFVLGLAVIVFLSRAACRPKPLDVTIVPIGFGPVEDVVTNSDAGTIKSRARARIGAERTGRVANIRFDEGAEVRRGDVIVELDASTARAQLAAARRDADAVEAAHEVAHSTEMLARQNWNRIDRLHSESVVSAEQRDEARARLDAAVAELKASEARLMSARAAVRIAEDEIGHLEVRAPFDGVVARHLVELGEPVIPGQPVIDLLSLEHLFASVPIDERDAGSLREGLAARVTLDAYSGIVWPGHVSRVAPMVEELKQQNRTIEVEVTLDSLADRPQVRAGMTADAEIVLGRADHALRVPTAAVLEGQRVFVFEGGRARARRVTLGRRNWEWSEVRSGITNADRLITSLDREGLRDGVAVREAVPAKAARKAAGS
jgi:HlyD family secretion protein